MSHNIENAVFENQRVSKVFIPTRNKIRVHEDVYLNSVHNDDANYQTELFKHTFVVLEDEKAYSLSTLLESKVFKESYLKNTNEEDVFDWSCQFYQESNVLTAKENHAFSSFIYKTFEDESVSCYLYEFSEEQPETISISDVVKTFHYSPVQFLSHSLSFEKDKLEFTTETKFDLKKIRLLGGLYHDTQNQALYFSREEELREEIKNLFSADKLKFKYKSLGFTLEKDSLKSSVSYEESFFKNPLDKLERFKNLFPESFELNFDIKTIQAPPMSLDFESDHSSKVVLYHGSDFTDLIFNKMIKILIGLKNGMAMFLGDEPAQVAINGPKRLNEIKLLKSSGFFGALLKIMLKAEKEMTHEELWQTLAPFIKSQLAEFAPQTTDMDDLVSKHFKDKVFEAFDVLNAEDTYASVIIEEESLNKVNFYTSIFGFIRPMLSHFENHYQEQFFYMDELKEFKFKLAQKERKTALELEFPFTLSIGKFMETNVCNLQKEEIKAFDPSFLEAKIEVKETSKEGGGEGDQKGTDWFDLDPKYYFNGVEISEEEARQFKKNSVVKYNGQLYYISETNSPVVKWLNYFWKRSDQQNNGNNKTENNDENKEVGYYRTHVLDVLALRQAGLPVSGGEKWERIASEYDSIEHQVKIDDEGFDGTLKPFQHVGVSWLIQLYRLGLGGILADDMGLGKTIQILSFFNHLKNHENKKNFLVVVPTSLVYNWESECEKFTPEMSIDSFSRDKTEDFMNERPNVVVTTYGLLSEHQEFFKSLSWDVIVFDEAQQLKNIKSMRSEVSRSLESDFKICLSGTPMENHYGEYFSLVDLSVPGALGDHKTFMRTYGPRKVSTGQISQSEVDYLKLKTKPLVLRRTKSQVLKELPEKTESVIKINFDEEQKEIYKNVAMIWNSKVQGLINSQGESKSQIQMFAALMKLRQICSCPGAIEESNYNKLSPKLSLVVDRVQELIEAGNSVLVFTNFILTLDTLKEELARRGVDTLSITGKNSQKKREETLANFNTDGAKALLMTLKTGGVGLNLTKASYILHVEPWWNPAAENQGTDRAHRIGQTNNVHVYRYIMKNSIEEKIQELKKQKQAAFEGLLEKDSQSIKEGTFSGGGGLTKKDFEYLLS